MNLRFQSSWEIKKIDNESILEISSSVLLKKYQIPYKNPCIFQFVQMLNIGIEYPEDMNHFATTWNIPKKSLESLIAKLKFHDLLIEDKETSKFPQDTLYDRQIRFFRTFENQTISGEQLNCNLQNRTVLIAGLGGYGSWIALLCARMGIRNIIGIDFDRVDITNLHRQILYDKNDIGELKVEACRKKINEVDPEINFNGYCLKVTNEEDLHPILDKVDFIFNPFSYIPEEKAINHPAGIIAKAAMKKKKPFLTFGGSWVGPLTVPGKTPCYFCAIKALEINKISINQDLRNPSIQKRAFVPPIAICCSMAAYEASRFLSGCDKSQVLQGMIQLDIFSFANSRFLPLEINPDCFFCKNLDKAHT